MEKTKIEKATVTLDVMRVNNKYYVGNHGMMVPVHESAYQVIVELEMLLNDKLKEKS